MADNTVGGTNMKLQKTLKGLVNRLLAPMGVRCVRIAPPQPPHPADLEAALTRLLNPHRPIATVVDIGASNGSWTKIVRRHLPAASFMLVEANPFHEPALKAFKAATPNVDYVISAAGDTVGFLNFDASDPFGGLATHEDIKKFDEQNLQAGAPVRPERFMRVPAVTVDSLVADRKLAPPFFLKLDTHGFELPILNGASETLKQTSLLQIECYNFKITKDNLRFHEMVAHMESKGFGVIDFCDPLYRVYDQAFWQADLFFAPLGEKAFQYHSYS